MQIAISFLVGIIFAAGLALSGMTKPENIIAFLDLQHWNPALLLVMASAMAVFTIAFQLIVRRGAPLLRDKFEIPTNRVITWQLVTGALLFGVGWGIAGFCGGPAIASLVSGRIEVFAFLLAMFGGMFLYDRLASQ